MYIKFNRFILNIFSINLLNFYWIFACYYIFLSSYCDKYCDIVIPYMRNQELFYFPLV